MFGRDERDDWPGGRMAFAGVGAMGAHGFGAREGWYGPWGGGARGRGGWGRGPWGGPWGPGFGPGYFGRRALMRHLFRRFGPGFGPGGGPGFGPAFGPGFGRGFGRGFGPGPRMFGRGDLKYALLELLQERPKHGYEMIKDLESRAGGFYTPSAGAIYPTLQLLEDRDWVTSQTVEGKKVYTITDAGRQALAAHQAQRPQRPQRPERPGPWNWGEHGHEHGHRHGRGDPWGASRPEIRALFHEGRAVARLMRAALVTSGGDPERLAQLRGIVERARNDLQAFVDNAGAGAQQRGEGPEQPGSSTTGPVEQV